MNILLLLDVLLVCYISTSKPYWPESYIVTLGGSSFDYGKSVTETSPGCSIVTGYTKSFGYSSENVLLAKYCGGSLEWSLAVGGNSKEEGHSIRPTYDGGFIVAGFSSSFGAGDYDVFLSKHFKNGSIEWAVALGSTEKDLAYSVEPTVDKGYIVVGGTRRYGNYDVLLCKFFENGTVQWSFSFGGSGSSDEIGYAVKQTSDEGYVLTGYTRSYGAGGSDILVAKFDVNGTFEWGTCLGSWYWDYGEDIQQTNDGGYILTGSINVESFGFGVNDVLLVKLYSNGSVEWATVSGGENDDEGRSVAVASDDGFVVAGSTYSFGAGQTDILLAKYFSNGTLNWMQAWGRTSNDFGYSVQKTSDDGFVVTGHYTSPSSLTELFVLKTDPNGVVTLFEGSECSIGFQMITDHPDEKYYEYVSSEDLLSESVVPVFSTESFSFEYISPNVDSLMGVVDEDLKCRVVSECNGVYYNGYNDEDVCSGRGICNPNGACQCHVDYFGGNCNITTCLGVYSNDSEEVCSGEGICVDYDECVDCSENYYGKFCLPNYASFYERLNGDGNNLGSDILQTTDEGYIVSGSTDSFGDLSSNNFLLAKFLADGALEWASATSYLAGKSIRETNDEGFIISGSTTRGDVSDILLAKYFADGMLEWALAFGVNSGRDDGFSAEQTEDNGFIVTGWITLDQYQSDLKSALLAKFSSNGTMEWGLTFGGTNYDAGNDVRQTIDGGFIIVGYTQSFGAGKRDIILAKFTAFGELEWASTLGGGEDETGHEVEVTSDGGYIIVGETCSFGNGIASYPDFLLAKYFSSGVLDWAITFGGTNSDKGLSVQQTSGDLGFLVGGTTRSFGSHIGVVHILVAKFQSTGDLDWARTIGADGVQVNIGSVRQTRDGGFCGTGWAKKVVNSEKDLFLYKIYQEGEGCQPLNSSVPFPSSNFIYPIYAQTIHPAVASITLLTEFSVRNITPDVSVQYNQGGDLQVNKLCESEFHCFGLADDSRVCSGHGDCTQHDICECQGSGRYFEENCQNQFCFDFLSNDSDHVCSSHGDCVDHDTCACDMNYTFTLDCSLWKCFGKFHNDSSVCNGGKVKTPTTSHGNCTKNDFCECEEGYRRSHSCDFECFGKDSWDPDACNGVYGECMEYNTCNCTSLKEYDGKYCDEPICGSIKKGDYGVCSGHGECENPDRCECEEGYFEETRGFCDYYTCDGIGWENKGSVCSNHGDCEDLDRCKCREEYDGTFCSEWSCGANKMNHPNSCNGKGKCKKPTDCECQFGYSGDLCETNNLYATVMAPTLSVGGLALFALLCIGATVACCCCLCVIICALLVVLCLAIFIFRQTFRYRKFGRLKNVDVLLQEQEADDRTDIAHIKINKKLFEIAYKEIKIEKILGEGGSNSTVYLAKWSGQKVAFKCFKTRTLCSSQDDFDEFEREATVFSSISHPNVVSFFGCTIDPPRVGILMEYCENGECLEFITKYEREKEERYPMKERFRMLHEISSAMEYLHARSIIHRDLKCENVLLNKNEECKLMDFGIARITENISHMTRGIGTSFYMAPEVTRGETFYDEKCDVFSFAIMCFILITSDNQPYGGESEYNIEKKVARSPTFRPNIKLMKRFLRSHELWIVEETQKSWNDKPQERPSFSKWRELFERERDEHDELGGDVDNNNYDVMKEQLPLDGDDNNNNINTHVSVVDDEKSSVSVEEILKRLKEKEELCESLKNELEELKKRLKE